VTTASLLSQSSAGAQTARRAIAGMAFALMVVVVVASALLRHLGATESMQTAWAPTLGTARLAHRVAATLVLLGSVLLVVLTRREPQRRVATFALLGVALLLSGVGVAAGPSRALPVVLMNLLGGFARLSLCARLSLPHACRGAGRAAWWLLGLAVLQAALGVAAGAFAPAACVGLTDCGVTALLHRVSGAALACALLAFGVWARRQTGRRAAAWLCGCAVLLLLLGALNAGIGGAAAPVLVVLHGALAAAALACLVRLA
jgi:hypothetical protein